MDKYINIKRCIEVVKNDPLCMHEGDNPSEIAELAYNELISVITLLSAYSTIAADLVVENHELKRD